MTSLEKNFYQTLNESSSEYKWILYNLSTCNKPFVTSRYMSSFGIDRWYLKLNLDRSVLTTTKETRNSSSQGKVSIYLYSLNDFNIRVSYAVTWSCNRKVYGTKKVNHTFKDKLGWGFEVMDWAVLLDILKKGNDILTITLKLVFFKKPELNNPRLNLINDFASLLQANKNSDVILISSDGIKHEAHKVILMCRSKVFSAMFQHDMKESQDNLVKIEDVDSNTLKEILQFIYTGEVKNIESNTQKLLLVADKYELNDLKRLCINKLYENLKYDNFLELMEFAHTYGIQDLKLKAKKYFLRNHKEIVLNLGTQAINEWPPHIATYLLYELATNQSLELINSS